MFPRPRSRPGGQLVAEQRGYERLREYVFLEEMWCRCIDRRQGPQDLSGMGFEGALGRGVLRLVNSSEFKRHQTPPIVRVSGKAFGVGRRMPIVGKYLS